MMSWTTYMLSRQVVAVRRDSDIYALSGPGRKRWPFNPMTKPEGAARRPEASGGYAGVSAQNRELIYPFLSKGYADAIAAHETAILAVYVGLPSGIPHLDEPLLTVGLGVAFALDDARGLEQALRYLRADAGRTEPWRRSSVGLDEPLRYMEGEKR